MATYTDARGQTARGLNVRAGKLDAGTVGIVACAEDGTAVIGVETPDRLWARATAVQIETPPGAPARAGRAELSRAGPGEPQTLTLEDEGGGALGSLRLKPEESRHVELALLNSAIEGQAQRDAEAMKTPPLEDAGAIKACVDAAITRSKADDGHEVECMEVRLADAEAVLRAMGLASEGGKAMGSPAYDLDVVEDGQITARLRVRWAARESALGC